MKWVLSNGKELAVRDCGPVLLRLSAAAVPLPIVDEIEEDDAARERVRALIATGLYDRKEPRRDA